MITKKCSGGAIRIILGGGLIQLLHKSPLHNGNGVNANCYIGELTEGRFPLCI